MNHKSYLQYAGINIDFCLHTKKRDVNLIVQLLIAWIIFMTFICLYLETNFLNRNVFFQTI